MPTNKIYKNKNNCKCYFDSTENKWIIENQTGSLRFETNSTHPFTTFTNETNNTISILPPQFTITANSEEHILKFSGYNTDGTPIYTHKNENNTVQWQLQYESDHWNLQTLDSENNMTTIGQTQQNGLFSILGNWETQQENQFDVTISEEWNEIVLESKTITFKLTSDNNELNDCNITGTYILCKDNQIPTWIKEVRYQQTPVYKQLNNYGDNGCVYFYCSNDGGDEVDCYYYAVNEIGDGFEFVLEDSMTNLIEGEHSFYSERYGDGYVTITFQNNNANEENYEELKQQIATYYQQTEQNYYTTEEKVQEITTVKNRLNNLKNRLNDILE